MSQDVIRAISIHAPRGGSDRGPRAGVDRRRDFNPRSPWGERLDGCLQLLLAVGISIHAPRGGSDPVSNAVVYRMLRFQSTLPVGGATLRGDGYETPFYIFQSTLPVGGATRIEHAAVQELLGISIHAPRGGSDIIGGSMIQVIDLFQSTLPVGGATLPSRSGLSGVPDFNPRSPWGERLITTSSSYQTDKISIHAPRGGSDGAGTLPGCGQRISIHAPRGGSDGLYIPCQLQPRHFNPRSPWGERPAARP